MGIYSTMHEGAVAIDLDKVTPVLESANFAAMSLEAVAESEANYNKIMEAIGISELSYFEANGQEIVYEAGGLAGFLQKAKEFFKNLWEKIKGIFHKFFAWLASLTKDSKAFAKKYGAEARKKWVDLDDSFSVKGYKFTHLDQPNWIAAVKAANDTAPADLEDIANKMASDFQGVGKQYFEAIITKSNEDWESKARAAIANSIVGSSDNELEAAEFAKTLKEGFRGGESSAIALEKSDIDLGAEITLCEDYSTTKKNAEKAYRDFEKEFNVVIKDLESMEKAVNKEKSIKDTDGTTEMLGTVTNAASKVVNSNKTIKQMLSDANGAYLQALKDQATQAKRIIAAVITTGKVKKESADLFSATQESGSLDFLSNIVLR